MINNTILIILLILFCSVCKTLKQKYMLNLKSSDKTSEALFHLWVQELQTWLSMHLVVYISIVVSVLHGYFSPGKTSGPTMKAAGSEALPQVVPFKVRSSCISQEVQVGFKQIHYSWKCEHESMSISSNDK